MCSVSSALRATTWRGSSNCSVRDTGGQPLLADREVNTPAILARVLAENATQVHLLKSTFPDRVATQFDDETVPALRHFPIDRLHILQGVRRDVITLAEVEDLRVVIPRQQ